MTTTTSSSWGAQPPHASDSALQPFHSLQSVRQGIHSLSSQLEKGFIDLSGGPARSSDGFKDTIDTYSRLLAQGGRILCIGEGGVGKSSLINYMVRSRMQSVTEYAQMNSMDGDKITAKVYIFSIRFSAQFLYKLCPHL